MSRRARLAAGFVLPLIAALLEAHPSRAEEPAPGRERYESLCASCHGPEGKGDGPLARDVVPMPRDFSVGAFKFDADSDGRTGTDADLALVIRDGALAYGGNPLMAGFRQLGDDAIAELVAYVRSLERERP
ncbi:MAG: cytochrome c [Myxococcota bacterium]|nr:cytochrome c [Myxococcota bacterium]